MSKPIIEVCNLSKSYQLGGIGARSLREAVERLWSRVWKNSVSHVLPSGEFSALQDVSFSVQPGEVIGIIGRNGAGKSTLLKILSRITEPTFGEVVLRGRVASLLEVGTGFHPDLSGQDNIFLNGAILGMKRWEIQNKFDEIVEFAGIQKFLKTPVKRYSSGMYVRLAFAVAAHLESEILIIDEILAVGDADFQKKCLGKMREISESGGRTVLFVSHTMQAVTTLCDKAILFKNGKVAEQGPARQVVTSYLSSETHHDAEAVWSFDAAPASDLVKLHSVRALNPAGLVSYDQKCGGTITLCMEFWCLKTTKVVPSFHLVNQQGIMVFPTGPLHIKEVGQKIYEQGLYRSSCVIPAELLNSGTYSVHAFLSRETDGRPYVHVPDVISFNVVNDGTGMGDAWTGVDDWPGVIRPLLPWMCSRVGELALTILSTSTILLFDRY